MPGAALALAFDVTSILALMYPGRDRVEITASDGVTCVYACKPGPQGETSQAQAETAMVAFEENVEKFGEALVGEMMQDATEGASTLDMAFSLSRKTDLWSGAMLTHLEKEFGSVLLG